MPDPLSASPLLPPCPAAASHTRARIRTRLGEYVFWDYLLVRSSEAQCGMDRIAEHGRTGHRLYEQWKSEVRRTPGPHLKKEKRLFASSWQQLKEGHLRRSRYAPSSETDRRERAKVKH